MMLFAVNHNGKRNSLNNFIIRVTHYLYQHEENFNFLGADFHS